MRRIVYNLVSSFLIVTALAGCTTTKYITVETVRTDTQYVAKWQHDSIYVIDSVFLHLWHDGDTVYVEKTKWQTKYVERLRVDTVYRSKADTVTVIKPAEEAAGTLTWWQRCRLSLADVVLIGLLVVAVFWITKKLLKW